jgi:predicted nucleic acid-binding Zn ribbon protein
MKIKLKDCIICGKCFRQWKSTHKCCSAPCQSIHNANKKKKTKTTLKPKPYLGINDLNVKNEVELYREIWEMRPHKSFLTNKPINIREGGDFWYNIFAHVLAKGKAKYPNFKLYSENIILLSPQEHNLLDFCSESDRKKYALSNGCSWDKVDDHRDKLIDMYKALY